MNTLDNNKMMAVISQMADIIIENEVPFCELDAAAGDGDFGMSIAKGFRQLKNEWDDLDKADIGTFLKSCSMVITEHCGGASGPIWGSAFRAASKSTDGKQSLTLEEFAVMLQEAVAGIQKRGGAKLGDKTLLDALIPTAESLAASAKAGLAFKEAFVLGAQAAADGAEKTRSYSASKGRASYVGDRSLNYPDAGAMALGIIFTKLAEDF